jgi:hypothetical protein
MLEATCHCGAVALRVDAAPARLTECNCSVCGRLGVLWAYYPSAAARVVRGANNLVAYAWGDRTIAFHHCGTCGCTTHYSGIGPAPLDRVAVNARLLPLEADAAVPVRRFDGKNHWKDAGDGSPWPWAGEP